MSAYEAKNTPWRVIQREGAAGPMWDVVDIQGTKMVRDMWDRGLARLMVAAPLMLEALEAEQAFVDHENRVCDLPGRGELPDAEIIAVWRVHDIKYAQLEQRAITLRTAALAAARGESPTRNEET